LIQITLQFLKKTRTKLTCGGQWQKRTGHNKRQNFIFRRAVEEGCLEGKRVIQIGLRGSGYSTTDYDWAKQQVKTTD
jgi:arginase family enzyme